MARRRILRFEDVVHAEQRRRVDRVQLDEHFLGLAQVGRRGAYGRAEHDASAAGQVAGFHDGPMDFTEKAVAHGLRQQRQMHVDEAHLAGVDLRAQQRVGLVRSAEADGLGVGEGGIERPAGGCAGEDADLELAAERVFLFGAFGERAGNGLGSASRREAAETDGFAVLDEGGGLFGGKNRIGQGHENVTP